MENQPTLRLRRCTWTRSTITRDSNNSVVEKRGSRRWDVCKTCSFVMIPATMSCQQCFRQKQLRSKATPESSITTKLRPFVVPLKFTIPRQPDGYLNTANFQKFIALVLDRIPNYLQSARVIKSSINEDYTSVVVSLTYTDLYHHLMALRIEHVQRWVRPVLQRMMHHPRNVSNVFNTPVSLEYFPDYLDKIHKPMDLGTIRSRLQRGCYDSVAAGFSDIALVFRNATTFNPASHAIYQLADTIRKDLDVEVEAIHEKCSKEVSFHFTLPSFNMLSHYLAETQGYSFIMPTFITNFLVYFPLLYYSFFFRWSESLHILVDFVRVPAVLSVEKNV